MKKLFLILGVFFVISGCNKVSLERLQGLWKVTAIREIPVDIFDRWEQLLDTTEVKVFFLENGDMKTFILHGDSASFTSGTYILMEEAEKLLISDTSKIFNSHGLDLDVTSLKTNELRLEGRYYVHGIIPSAPTDSFIIAQWVLSK